MEKKGLITEMLIQEEGSPPAAGTDPGHHGGCLHRRGLNLNCRAFKLH